MTVPLIIVLMLESVRELRRNAGTLTSGTLMLALACLVAGITVVTELKHYRTGTSTITLVLESRVMGIPPWPLVLLRSVLWTTLPYRNAGLLDLLERSYLPPTHLARLLILRRWPTSLRLPSTVRSLPKNTDRTRCADDGRPAE